MLLDEPEEAKQQQSDIQQPQQCTSCGNRNCQPMNDMLEDDPTIVQAKFNISETVEVVHMGPAAAQQYKPGAKAAASTAAAAQNAQRFAQQQQQ